MKDLYACIEINKKETCQKTEYYITKEEVYGLQVIEDGKIKNIENITNDKTKIKNIASRLVDNAVTMENLDNVLDDVIA